MLKSLLNHDTSCHITALLVSLSVLCAVVCALLTSHPTAVVTSSYVGKLLMSTCRVGSESQNYTSINMCAMNL